MPLIITAITEPDGTTPVQTSTRYLVSGSGAAAYFRFPGQAWDTIEISWKPTSIPDRDFARVSQPPRSQLAQFVDQGFVTVYDTTAPGFLTGDQIRDYS